MGGNPHAPGARGNVPPLAGKLGVVVRIGSAPIPLDYLSGLGYGNIFTQASLVTVTLGSGERVRGFLPDQLRKNFGDEVSVVATRFLFNHTHPELGTLRLCYDIEIETSVVEAFIECSRESLKLVEA
ncbi:MAG: hypothetical protein WC636_00540 [Candidatus Margulisiibacteriota bacterium]